MRDNLDPPSKVPEPSAPVQTELVRNAALGPAPELLNGNLHFNKMPPDPGDLCALKA